MVAKSDDAVVQLPGVITLSGEYECTVTMCGQPYDVIPEAARQAQESPDEREATLSMGEAGKGGSRSVRRSWNSQGKLNSRNEPL
jgi:hypothetical protein